MMLDWLLLPALLVAAFTTAVLSWTAFAQLRFWSFHRQAHEKPPRLGWTGWLIFYLRTLRGAFLLLWWFFRGALQTGLRRPAGGAARRPVLCVHGLFMNSTAMWGIRRRVERLGRPSRGVFMGAPVPSPLTYIGPLSRVMREMGEGSSRQGFDIVAHSLGGVMVREVLRRHPELADAVRRVVTLGSPHHGTAVVRWMRFGPIYRLLKRDSEYLARLPTLRDVAPAASVTTVATRHDLVVYPTDTAHLPGAGQVTLEGISHLGLLTEPRVMDVVAAALEGNPVGYQTDS